MIGVRLFVWIAKVLQPLGLALIQYQDTVQGPVVDGWTTWAKVGRPYWRIERR